MDIEDKKLIVDPALTGKDGCGINVFYGLVCVERVNLMKLTPVEFVKAVRAMKDRHHIPNHKIIFDGSGLGALATASFEGAISYLGNASVIYKPNKVLPKDRRDEERPNFDMLGTQCGYKLAEMIKKGQIFYGPSCKLTEADKDSISEQLAQLKRRDMLDDRKLRLVVKDEIIANIGYSPTDFDILKMLAWFELKKEAEPKRRALRQEGHDM
jgi:hypothetical protein